MPGQSRYIFVSNALVALSAALGMHTSHAQSSDSPFTPRELREQSREFRPSRIQAMILESVPQKQSDGEFKFSGNIGGSVSKGNDSTSSASLPIELDVTHVASGVTLALSTDLHAWSRENGETIHGAGASTAKLTRKWDVVKDQSSLTGRVAATFDSGSAVSDPNSRLVALVYGQKLSDLMSMSVVGNLVQGPRIDTPGISRNVVAASVRLNRAIGANNEHTAWAKFGASRRNGAGSRTNLMLGLDFVFQPEIWEGTLSVARGLTGPSRTTAIGLDISRLF